MDRIKKLLNTTSAGQIAKKLVELDKIDGKDNKITANIWNQFVQGKGKTIQTEISIGDALNSITTYAVREAAKQNRNVEEIAKEWLEWTPSGKGNATADVKKKAKQKTTQKGKTPPANQAAQAAKAKQAKVENVPVQKPKTTEQKKETPPANQEVPIQEEKEIVLPKQEDVDADYNTIAFSVPQTRTPLKTPPSDYTNKSIVLAQQKGKQVADEILESYNAIDGVFAAQKIDNMEAKLKNIDKDNVIYVTQKITNLAEVIDWVDGAGYGFDQDEIINYVLNPLVEKAKEYGIKEVSYNLGAGQSCITSLEFYNPKNWVTTSVKSLNALINTLSAEIRQLEKKKLGNYNNELKAYNTEQNEIKLYYRNKEKIQENFDSANTLLAEVANMPKKPEITSPKANIKKIKLSNGRWIEAEYKGNELVKITIGSNNSKYATVRYSAREAFYNINNDKVWDGKITQNFDFAKIKAIAEKIFTKSSS